MSSTEASEGADIRVGDVVDGRYELCRDLGQGAAGRVFEAIHKFTGRSVALKLVAPDVPPSLRVELHARLLREARALAAVRHPGVVDVLDGGFLPDRTPFLVMEMLEGRTLEGLIAARGHLSVDDTIAVALQLCDALGAAHAVGVVHRDVKSSNILVVRDHAGREVIKLVDFGIARVTAPENDKLTGLGALIGTPAYMAPEQLLALADVDNRSDVYALGVTMFECLSGRMPYEGNYPQVLLQVCSTDPVPSVDSLTKTVPAPLAGIVSRAMKKERADRYGWMKDFADGIRAAFPAASAQTHFFATPPPIPPAPLAASQRRKLARASYVTPVRLIIGDLTVDCRTEDISTGGVLLICHRACPTAHRASLRLALPTDGKVVSLDVEVRWVRAARADDPDGPRALGVEFVDPPADMVSAIARYVSFMTVPEAP